MPYNGKKAREARERLTMAVLNAKTQPFEADAPVQGGRVTSPYGWRKHPILGVLKKHEGADIAAPTGTPIYATADGYISQAQHKSSGSVRGNNVSIKHPGGQETRYEHMDRFAPAALKGGPVRKGDLIGYVGSTGRSTGPHLHYGMLDRGVPVDPFAPMIPWARYASR